MASGIYAIRHRVSLKMYIGSTNNMSWRWYRHERDLETGKHHSRHLQRAWNKHGKEAFEFIVLEESETDLVPLEQTYLDKFETYKPSKGYNISAKASGPSGEAISRAHKARYAANPSALQHSSEFAAYARSFVKNVRNQFRRWTPEEDEYLRKNYVSDGIRACAIAINRAECATRQRASRLGLRAGDSKRERYRQAALVREAARRMA